MDEMKTTKKTAQQPPPPKWLLLVHMTASAPNLEEPQRFDFEELSRPLRELGMDPTDRVVIIVQVDTATGVSKRFRLTNEKPDFIDIFPTEPKSLQVFLRDVFHEPVDCEEEAQRQEKPCEEDEERQEKPCEEDEERPKKLKKVLAVFFHKWPPSSRPSSALVVWGHAAGVGRGLEAPSSAGNPGNLYFLPSAVHLDVVGFDACFMASVELAYEIRNTADYMLAPEAGISLQGWHYDQLVDQILANPAIDPDSLCKTVIEQVGLSFSSPEQLSLLRLGSELKGLKGSIHMLRDALYEAYTDDDREPQMRQWILDAFCEAIWVGARQLLDLGDLCRVLASRIPKRSVREAALGVLQVLASVPPPPERQIGPAADRQRDPKPGLVADQLSLLDVPLSGISIYCPWPRATQCEVRAGLRNVSVDKREYRKLEFVSRTGWGSFMFHHAAILDAERRWIVREAAQEARSIAEEVVARAEGTKPASRAEGTKPAGRAEGTKPANRSSTSIRGPRPPEEY